MKPVSGPATSESHHPRDTGNSQSAAAANEQEQRLNDEASANYFSNRSRKSSTDFDASTTSPGDETVGAQELRPRTTTLSGVSGPAETAGTCSSRFYGAYDATQDTIPAADLFSEPSTPLEGEQPQSKHRPAALQLNNQKFPSADSIQVGSARHAPPKSPLRQGKDPF